MLLSNHSIGKDKQEKSSSGSTFRSEPKEGGENRKGKIRTKRVYALILGRRSHEIEI